MRSLEYRDTRGMRRALVIGSGGAGKSTLARELGARAGLPVVHLDRLYWRPGWTKTPMARPEVDDPEVIDRVTRTMALRKIATPEDIARQVVVLSSD